MTPSAAPNFPLYPLFLPLPINRNILCHCCSQQDSLPNDYNSVSMEIPQELLVMVCSSLTRAELKGARAVCKSLEQAASRFLFDSIYVSETISDLTVANLLATRFAATIETVTVSLANYPNYSKAQFNELGQEQRQSKSLTKRSEHLQHAFQIYHKLCKAHEEMMRTGELVAQLCLILHRLTKAQKLIITNHGYCNNSSEDRKEPRVRPHDPWTVADLCPYETCNLSEADHLSFHVRPYRPFFEDKSNLWHVMMLALSTTKSSITSIVAMPQGYEGLLPITTLMTTERESYHLTACFANLKRLRLSLTLVRTNNDPLRGKFGSGDIVARAISAAVNLESLFIETRHGEGMQEPTTTMESILGGCQFPKLECLILMYMSSEEQQLLDFLSGSRHLNHLTLDYCTLSSGT